jgi:hypothetical protein
LKADSSTAASAELAQRSDATTPTAHETTVQSLAGQTGASLADAQRLFDAELARLGQGATVRTYLHLLATSNVRAGLRRSNRREREVR